MKFEKERVYTAINADELKPGDKVVVADTMQGLRYKVKANEGIDTLYGITDEGEEKRFSVKDKHDTVATEWLLAYLVERADNCTNCGGRITCVRQKPEHPELTKCCNYKRYECSEYKPITEQKAEKDCDNCGQRCDGYGKGDVCSQWKSKAEKHTDYNHCEEAMISARLKKHYRSFKNVDELIKVWNAKIGMPRCLQSNDALTMPYIWVKKHDDTDRGKLIISFSNNGCSVIDVDEIEVLLWEDLFNIYTFLDGSPCGVEE